MNVFYVYPENYAKYLSNYPLPPIVSFPNSASA